MKQFFFLFSCLFLLHFIACKKDNLTPEQPISPGATNPDTLPSVAEPPETSLSFTFQLDTFDWYAGDYFFESDLVGHRLVQSGLEKTTDGGHSWQPLPFGGGAYSYTRMLYAAKDTVSIVSAWCSVDDCNDCDSYFYYSTNGGMLWESKHYYGFFSPDFYSGSAYFTSGFYHSPDLGTTKEYLLRNVGEGKIFAKTIHGKSVYVFYENRVKVSHNFGESWLEYPLPLTMSYFYRMLSPDPATVAIWSIHRDNLLVFRNYFSSMENLSLPGIPREVRIIKQGGYFLGNSFDSLCNCSKYTLSTTIDGGMTWDNFATLESAKGVFVNNQNNLPVSFRIETDGRVYRLTILEE